MVETPRLLNFGKAAVAAFPVEQRVAAEQAAEALLPFVNNSYRKTPFKMIVSSRSISVPSRVHYEALDLASLEVAGDAWLAANCLWPSLPAQETPETVNEDLVVSDIEALRHKLGYSRWILLGHSFGTFTAMKYAIAHPEHVRAMVLLAVTPPRQADDHMDANLQARLPASAGPAFHALMVKSRAATTDAERNELSEQMNEIVLPAYLYDHSKMGEVIALSKAAGMNAMTAHLIQQSVGNYDLTNGLSTISAPTLIVQGVADPLDPSIAAKTQAAIPNAKLSALSNCGHFAWVEAPDKLSPLLSKFSPTNNYGYPARVRSFRTSARQRMCRAITRRRSMAALRSARNDPKSDVQRLFDAPQFQTPIHPNLRHDRAAV